MSDPIILEPNRPATAAVIWLHGLGADGNDFVPVIPMLGLPEDHSIRFIFPHAKSRPITINAGYVMPGWYDILDLNDRSKEDEVGIRDSEKTIISIINQQHSQGIAYDKIFLVGFSQGAAMALHTGLRFPEKLAGVVALSGYLPLGEQLKVEKSSANQETPLLICHGTQDDVVPFSAGERTYNYLKLLNYSVKFRHYLMGHSVCDDQLKEIGSFISLNF